jgi:hypothetical protein
MASNQVQVSGRELSLYSNLPARRGPDTRFGVAHHGDIVGHGNSVQPTAIFNSRNKGMLK